MAEVIFGFDTSKWQGGAYTGGGGYLFGVAKATEGVGYLDSAWDRHITAILNQPIIPGAYHFSRPDLNPGTRGAWAEADWFWAVVSARGGAGGMLLANDMEAGQGALGGWRDEFNGRLAWQAGGYQAGWYTYWNFAYTRALNYPTPYWGWLAWPDANGALPGTNFQVAMQQFGLAGVPGLTGGVDVNRFFGSEAQLAQLTVGHAEGPGRGGDHEEPPAEEEGGNMITITRTNGETDTFVVGFGGNMRHLHRGVDGELLHNDPVPGIWGGTLLEAAWNPEETELRVQGLERASGGRVFNSIWTTTTGVFSEPVLVG